MPKKPARLKIETRLPVLRAERKVTQEELAREVGVTRATIVAIEKGRSNPSLELALRLSQFFETEIQRVFWVKGEANGS